MFNGCTRCHGSGQGYDDSDAPCPECSTPEPVLVAHKWKGKAEKHMTKTKHSVQWSKDGWKCNSCGEFGPKPQPDDDWDGGQYYDNFVDGRGF